MNVDIAKAMVAKIRQKAQYQSMVKRGVLDAEAAQCLINVCDQDIAKLKAVAGSQGELPVNEAKRK